MGTNNKIYDNYSNPYDKVVLNWQPYLDLRQSHLNFVDFNGITLDLGAGTGNQTSEVAKYGKVYAVDINESMIKQIFGKVDNGNVMVLKMDAQNLAFNNNVFDSITSMNLIYNLPDPNKGIGEAYRTLKPGGILSVSGPLPKASSDEISDHCIGEMKSKGLYDDTVSNLIEQMRMHNNELLKSANYFSKEDMQDLLKKSGFKNILHSSDDHYMRNAYFVAAQKD